MSIRDNSKWLPFEPSKRAETPHDRRLRDAVDRLFGEDRQCTEDIAQKIKRIIVEGRPGDAHNIAVDSGMTEQECRSAALSGIEQLIREGMTKMALEAASVFNISPTEFNTIALRTIQKQVLSKSYSAAMKTAKVSLSLIGSDFLKGLLELKRDD